MPTAKIKWGAKKEQQEKYSWSDFERLNFPQALSLKLLGVNSGHHSGCFWPATSAWAKAGVSQRASGRGQLQRGAFCAGVFWSGGEGISSVKACCSNCSTVLLSLTMIRGGRGGAESTYESWPSLAEVSQYFVAVCKRSSNSWLGRIQLCCKHTCRYGSVSYQPRCRSQGASLPASQQFARANSRWLNQMKQ